MGTIGFFYNVLNAFKIQQVPLSENLKEHHSFLIYLVMKVIKPLRFELGANIFHLPAMILALYNIFSWKKSDCCVFLQDFKIFPSFAIYNEKEICPSRKPIFLSVTKLLQTTQRMMIGHANGYETFVIIIGFGVK